jgi:hypothetical protein
MIFYDIPKKSEPAIEEKESVVSLPAPDLDAVEVEDDSETVELPAPEEDDIDEVAEEVEPVALPAPKLTIQALFDRLRLQRVVPKVDRELLVERLKSELVAEPVDALTATATVYRDDINLFASALFANYAPVTTPNYGLFPHQHEILEQFANRDKVVVAGPRQIGVTTTNVIFALWYAMCNPKSHVVMFSPNSAQSQEAARIARDLVGNFSGLFFSVDCRKESVDFDNGSWIRFCTVDYIPKGFSLNAVIFDLAGFSKDESLLQAFVDSLSAMASGGGKMLVTNTGYATNKMFGAFRERDDFYQIQCNWWDRPGRDYTWKRKMIVQMGKENFEKDFVIY